MKRKLLLLALSLVMLISSVITAFAAEEGETTTITILETSDIHGMIFPHDYTTDTPTSIGLAKVFTIVKAEREIDPNLILVENGDNAQGNMIQMFRTEEVVPMVRAMNMMGYDISVLGNHEFNFEFEHLLRSIEKRDAVVVTSNIYNKSDDTRWQEPYYIKEINGVKVGFFGLTAPHVPRWESDPSNYQGLYFTSPMEETGKVLDEMEGMCDLVIGIAHYGEVGEYEYEREGMFEVAKAYADRIDGLMIGHAHSTIAETLDCGVPIVEPGYQGANVAKLTYTMKHQNGKWVKVDAVPEVMPTKEIEPDQELMKELQYVHDQSVAVSNTVVGRVGETFLDSMEFIPGIPITAIQDNPIIDLVNKVQLAYSGADVSLTAPFNQDSNLVAGDFKNKDAQNVYKYHNTLCAVKVTGAELKAIMQKCAGDFFNEFKEGDVTISFRSDVRLGAFDQFAGVEYEIDISKPFGERIINVMYKGAPLADDEELILALNDYRYNGLIADGMLKAENTVYMSTENEVARVTDMIAAYVAKQGVIYPETDNNWRIIGYTFDDPQKELIYEMVRNGEIVIETSADKRTPNVVALNGPALRAAGILPPLDDKSTSGSNSGRGGGSTTYYTLSFEVGGGSSLERVSKASGSTVDLSAYTTTRDGYSFAGWYNDADLTTKVTSLTLSKNMTVYAKWTESETSEPESKTHTPYISGYTDGTFRPDASITRAETAQLLYNLLDNKSGNCKTFTDVESAAWYYDAVSLLAGNGVITGYTDGTFSPSTSITRVEFVTLVARYAELGTQGTESFSDANGHSANAYIGAALNAGYIEGYSDGTFRPDAAITRAEAVTILNRMLGLTIVKSELNTLTMPFSDVSNSHWAYYNILESTVKHAHTSK